MGSGEIRSCKFVKIKGRRCLLPPTLRLANLKDTDMLWRRVDSLA